MLRSKTIKEGTLGLFIIIGLLVFGGSIFWLKGGNLKDKNYQIIVEFEDAGGLREGAKVRYRGIEVGKIIEILPSSNGVDIVIEIGNNLKIPKQVTIGTNRYGLLGEAVVDIIPKKALTAAAESIDPFSKKCQEDQLILCNQEMIKGQKGAELLDSLENLSELYGSPEFFNNLNTAAKNAALAGEKIAVLSDELTNFSKDIKKDLNKVSETANAFTNTANVTTQQINRLSDEFSSTSVQLTILINNINEVINENRSNFNQAITSVTDTSNNLSNLIKELEYTTTEVNSVLKKTDSEKIVKNLEEFSNNLKEISASLNQPTNLVTLQKTLDSARVTFENTAKITSDLDELTGDPEFRNKVKQLVDGLSNLLSYNETLEKQIELAKILESANQIAVKETTIKKDIVTSSNQLKINKKNKKKDLKKINKDNNSPNLSTSDKELIIHPKLNKLDKKKK